jgi:hypothetical protein
MKRKKTKKRRSLWHSAFIEAMQKELKPWENALYFEAEYLLNAAPFAMDLLIIKKKADMVIDNPIAAMFRKHNILEYKSPKGYISVFDFHKVLGYAYIYSALNGIPLEDITITFVEDHYPVKLFKHLIGVDYRIEEKQAGIYSIQGDRMFTAVQFIVRKRISGNDSLWLKGLGDDLSVADLERLLDEALKEKEAPVKGAYMDLLLKVNREIVKEISMKKKSTWEEISEELGYKQEWEKSVEARVEARAAAEREQFRQEIERLRKEVEQLRTRQGAYR